MLSSYRVTRDREFIITGTGRHLESSLEPTFSLSSTLMESTHLAIGKKGAGDDSGRGEEEELPCLASFQPAPYNSLLQFLTVWWPTNKSRGGGRNKESGQRNRGAENASDTQVLPVKPKFQSSNNLLQSVGPWWEGKSFGVLEEIS